MLKKGKWDTRDDWSEEQKKEFNQEIEKHATVFVKGDKRDIGKEINIFIYLKNTFNILKRNCCIKHYLYYILNDNYNKKLH